MSLNVQQAFLREMKSFKTLLGERYLMVTHLKGFLSILYTEMPGEHLPHVFGKFKCKEIYI